MRWVTFDYRGGPCRHPVVSSLQWQISWYLMVIVGILLVLISITWWQFKDVLFAIYTNPGKECASLQQPCCSCWTLLHVAAEFDMTQRHRSPRGQDTQPMHSSPRPRAQKATGAAPSPHASKHKSQAPLHWPLNSHDSVQGSTSTNANPLSRMSAGSSAQPIEGFVPPNPAVTRNTSAFTPGPMPVAEPESTNGLRHRLAASTDTASSGHSWVFDKAMRRMGSDSSLPATIDDM
jgi:hypothetical protein